MAEEAATENSTAKSEVTLDIEVANGIKYTFVTLDEAKAGEVAKSQLQAIVANVCRAIKTPYVSEDLDDYLSPKEKLTVFEFLDFLETKLLVKGKKLNQKEMDELSWVMVGQKYEDSPHLISKKDAFKLWLAFKKLDIGGDLKVDVEELCIFLEKFIRSMGVQWNEQFVHEYTEEDGTSLTFWKFLECLEKKFLEGIDKNVLKEGLQDLYASILDEVTLTGFLQKKGHSMLKSQKSRWFVLTPDKLTYYVSSGYREKKGEVILNSEAKVASIPDKGSNKCRFLVTCGQTKKEYEQTAPDQRNRQAWISAIQTAIDCCGGDTPLKRDLVTRKLKRDEDRRRKAEEERKRQEQDDLLSQQREEIDLLKKRKAEIERFADEEKEMLDAEIKRREELEELQRNLQQLLEEQKRAREEEEKVRAAKERLLEEERLKREQLEALRLQQQQELQEEKMQKEELIERQKEQQRILEEERKRLQHLEEERMKAEEAAKAAQDKLTAAESAAKNAAEQAKDRVRQIKTSIGLKGTIGPKVDPLVSHRGKGAFTLEEFLNRATEWSGLELEEGDKYRPQEQHEKAKYSEEELVKASATATPNKNLPEFLKKAAAWSGLNPDTYLEEGKEEGGKKGGSPPKVAAKPSKPAVPEQNGPSVKKEEGTEGESKEQVGVGGEPTVTEVPPVATEPKEDVQGSEGVEETNNVPQETEGESKEQMGVDGKPTVAEVTPVALESKEDVQGSEGVEGTNGVPQETEGESKEQMGVDGKPTVAEVTPVAVESDGVVKDEGSEVEVPQEQERTQEEPSSQEEAKSEVPQGEPGTEEGEGTVSGKAEGEPVEPETNTQAEEGGTGSQGDSQVDAGVQEVAAPADEKNEVVEKEEEGEGEGDLQEVSVPEGVMEDQTKDTCEAAKEAESNASESSEKENMNAEESKEVESGAKVEEKDTLAPAPSDDKKADEKVE